MISKRKMNAAEISTMIRNINNVQIKINSASGAAVMVEIRMRLIGELSEEVTYKLKELIKSKKKPRSTGTVSSAFWMMQ